MSKTVHPEKVIRIATNVRSADIALFEKAVKHATQTYSMYSSVPPCGILEYENDMQGDGHRYVVPHAIDSDADWAQFIITLQDLGMAANSERSALIVEMPSQSKPTWGASAGTRGDEVQVMVESDDGTLWQTFDLKRPHIEMTMLEPRGEMMFQPRSADLAAAGFHIPTDRRRWPEYRARRSAIAAQLPENVMIGLEFVFVSDKLVN